MSHTFKSQLSVKGRTIDAIKNILNNYFQKHPEVEVAYIFGSVAQGNPNALSDVDIAIIIDHQQINEEAYGYGYRAEILADLIKLLKTNHIDLIILNEANTLLKHRVLYFGKVIYTKNERKRIEFQTNTINKYNDFKQLIKPYLAGVESD